MITLYQRTDCPFCWKVRLALAELGLRYRKADLRLGEKPAALRALSPTGSVPVLVDCTDDEELVIWESAVMLEYLSQRYGQGALFPADPAAAVRERLLHAWSDKQLGAGLKDLVFEKRSKTEAEWDHDLLREAGQRWQQCQDYLEHHWAPSLPKTARLLSAAECALAARLGVADAYGVGVSEACPKLSAWFSQIKQRPGWQQAFPTAFIRPEPVTEFMLCTS